MNPRIANRYNVNRRPPARHTWIDNQGCDAETLVEIAREMSEFFEHNPPDLDDSRCFYRLCIDMALDFQLIHKNFDWTNTDFLPAIMAYTENVKHMLSANPSWINTDYKWMYGSETVPDLLSKRQDRLVPLIP